MGAAVVAPAVLRKKAPRAGKNGLCRSLGLGNGIHAHDGQLRIAAVAIDISGAYLVSVRGCAPARAAERHHVGRHLGEPDLREVADDVGQQVAGGITDLV
ncbi:hypothetical protein D3C72_2325910 [compost metagenome]